MSEQPKAIKTSMLLEPESEYGQELKEASRLQTVEMLKKAESYVVFVKMPGDNKVLIRSSLELTVMPDYCIAMREISSEFTRNMFEHVKRMLKP